MKGLTAKEGQHTILSKGEPDNHDREDFLAVVGTMLDLIDEKVEDLRAYLNAHTPGGAEE